MLPLNCLKHFSYVLLFHLLLPVELQLFYAIKFYEKDRFGFSFINILLILEYPPIVLYEIMINFITNFIQAEIHLKFVLVKAIREK